MNTALFGGGSSDPGYGHSSTTAGRSISVASGSSKHTVLLTEGGASPVPFLPTIRRVVSGGLREVLSEMDIATQDDIDQVTQRLDHLEEKVDRIDDDTDRIQDLPTTEEMRILLSDFTDD